MHFWEGYSHTLGMVHVARRFSSDDPCFWDFRSHLVFVCIIISISKNSDIASHGHTSVSNIYFIHIGFRWQKPVQWGRMSREKQIRWFSNRYPWQLSNYMYCNKYCVLAFIYIYLHRHSVSRGLIYDFTLWADLNYLVTEG